MIKMLNTELDAEIDKLYERILILNGEIDKIKNRYSVPSELGGKYFSESLVNDEEDKKAFEKYNREIVKLNLKLVDLEFKKYIKVE